jgi:transcriptional regulator with XRE-family HTH domain
MSRIKSTFALKMALIRERRSFRDFSDDIMQKTGVSISHSTLHDYENTGNNIMPKSNNLEALAEYAGVQPSWFFEEPGIEYQKPDDLLKGDTIVQTGEMGRPKYITDEFALEVARIISKEGTMLNEGEKAFLLNMIRTYIASAANGRQQDRG